MILCQTSPLPKVLVLLCGGAVCDKIRAINSKKLNDTFKKKHYVVRMHKETNGCDSKESCGRAW
jgi:hypothetical protein